MTAFDLTAFQEEMETTMSPWEVKFGTEEEPKTAHYKHLLLVTAECRKDFLDLLNFVGKLATGKLTEAELAEAELAGEKDIYDVMTSRIQKAFKGLATKKKEHQELVDAFPNQHVIWDRMLQEYVNHFKVNQGE